MDSPLVQPDDGATLDLIYNEIRARLAAQVEYSRALDSKAELVLSSSSLIITIGVGLKGLLGGSAPSSCMPIRALGTAIFVLSGAFYAASMVLGFRAYTLYEFHRQASPRTLWDKYLPMEPVEARRRLIQNMIVAYENNRETITSQKVPSLKWALRCLVAETLSLLVALILAAG